MVLVTVESCVATADRPCRPTKPTASVMTAHRRNPPISLMPSLRLPIRCIPPKTDRIGVFKMISKARGRVVSNHRGKKGRVRPAREERIAYPLGIPYALDPASCHEPLRFTGDMDALVRGTWPGNVRELENAVERAVILSVGEYITERELPQVSAREESHETAESLSNLAGMPLDDVEREVILATLRDVGGNKSEAARVLGITRATLHKKLKRYEEEE